MPVNLFGDEWDDKGTRPGYERGDLLAGHRLGAERLLAVRRPQRHVAREDERDLLLAVVEVVRADRRPRLELVECRPEQLPAQALADPQPADDPPGPSALGRPLVPEEVDDLRHSPSQ